MRDWNDFFGAAMAQFAARNFAQVVATQEACRDPNADTTTRAYNVSCTFEHFQGLAICGADAAGAEASGSIREAPCSTHPSHSIDNLKEESSRICDLTLCDVTEYFNAFVANGKRIPETGSLTTTGSARAAAKIFDYARAFVTSPYPESPPPGASRAALHLVPPTGDIEGNTCAFATMQPTVEGGDIMISSGMSLFFGVRVTADGAIMVGGDAGGMVVGGENAGRLAVTTSGRLMVSDVVNRGNLDVDGSSNIFISNVINHGALSATQTSATLVDVYNGASGSVTLTGGTAYAYSIQNAGQVAVRGGSTVYLDLVAPADGAAPGAVVFEAGTNGAVCTDSASTAATVQISLESNVVLDCSWKDRVDDNDGGGNEVCAASAAIGGGTTGGGTTGGGTTGGALHYSDICGPGTKWDSATTTCRADLSAFVSFCREGGEGAATSQFACNTFGTSTAQTCN